MQAIAANNAHTAICDLIRFYFRNGLTHYAFSGASLCARKCACIDKCDIGHWHENNVEAIAPDYD